MAVEKCKTMEESELDFTTTRPCNELDIILTPVKEKKKTQKDSAALLGSFLSNAE